ncbi:hypothetical protein TrCOL_g7288 [Triparma columacea]|uniref:Uncharacterized protein n=1 Tax=Triparma columacea TaxID=722753 RepID=A0A9W7GRE4_9STRA|nr:hypothetical protein TrCOL_g7288 [Triparma columacea]
MSSKLTEEELKLLKEDSASNPGCRYSVSSSSSISYKNGSSSSTTTVKVFRQCNDTSRNKYVVDRTSEKAGESSATGGDDVMKDLSMGGIVMGHIFGGHNVMRNWGQEGKVQSRDVFDQIRGGGEGDPMHPFRMGGAPKFKGRRRADSDD